MSGTVTTQPITFNEIPASPNWKVPGFYAETRPGYAGIGVLPIPARNLLVGQMTAGGTGLPLTIYPNVTDPTLIRGLGGPGSQIDRIVTAHLAAKPQVPVDVVMVADAAGAAKAAWTRTFTAAATGNGTYAVNICGTRITFGVLSGDAGAAQATDLAAAINAVQTLPVTASAATDVVTVTAKNGGLEANAFTFIENPMPGDVTPAGMTPGNWTQTVQGATNPAASTVTAIMNGWWTDVLLPWSDAANGVVMETEAERRFTAMVREDMRVHVGLSATLSASITAAFAINGKFTYLSAANGWGSEPYVVAAVAMAVAANSLLGDPSQQLGGQALPGIVGPVYASQWNDETSQQSLLTGGVSTYTFDRHGVPTIQRYVSTYTQNAQGALDPAWFDIMETAVATRIRYDWRLYKEMVWGAAKLAPDASPAAQLTATNQAAGTGQKICTPSRMMASWMARRQTYIDAGWIEDLPADVAATRFIIDPNDPNRLDEEIHYTRIGNLMIDAAVMIFEER